MSRVVHFELFGEDVPRMTEFYRAAFGWDVLPQQGPFEYRAVRTGPEGTAGIDGAIVLRLHEAGQRVVLTVEVADVDAAVARAGAAGGSTAAAKRAVPGVGWVAYVSDPTGLVVGLMQRDLSAGAREGTAARETEAAVASAAAASEAAEGRSSEEAAGEGDVWEQIGDSLKEFADAMSRAYSEAASSRQAQRLRDEGERAARQIREASRSAADKARPHVVSALDRMSEELGDLAVRLRRESGESEAESAEPRASSPGEASSDAGTDTGIDPPPDEY